MSKRKRNVAFTKPDEPAFIARMKAEAGYEAGPTVHTKREVLSSDEEDIIDRDDELPQVVVVKEGDLTSEEAATIQQLKEDAPADLNDRIVFRRPSKSIRAPPDTPGEQPHNSSSLSGKDKKKSCSASEKNRESGSRKKSLLSFNDDEEEHE